MKKPLIGIVSKYFKLEEFYNWSWQRISNQLRYALCKNGANVIGILPQTENLDFQEKDEHDETKISEVEKQELAHFVDLCDGIVLQGGVNSAYYEEFIAKYCYEKNIPTLGICAGFNTMIRAFGGTTNFFSDDIHNRPDKKYAHKCIIADSNSIFAKIQKEKIFDVNSIHTYKADKLPNQLSKIAVSEDGQIEVVEAKDKKFYMGLKYHPELLINDDLNQNEIFKYFIDTCKNN